MTLKSMSGRFIDGPPFGSAIRRSYCIAPLAAGRKLLETSVGGSLELRSSKFENRPRQVAQPAQEPRPGSGALWGRSAVRWCLGVAQQGCFVSVIPYLL